MVFVLSCVLCGGKQFGDGQLTTVLTVQFLFRNNVRLKELLPGCGTESSFLGAFPKLRKATIIFVMSVCLSARLSIRMEQLGSHRTDFHEI